MINKRRALISVSDKTGVVELASELIQLGFEIISTGGTARILRDNGLVVTEASEVTGFPEILGGRVKTLHPYIHAAILACPDREDQCLELEKHGIEPIELVVVNLYPFEQTVAREETGHAEAVENIDIGGPTMLRAAAKNHAYLAVVVNPARYGPLIEELKSLGNVSEQTRFRLAAEAFAHTAGYDAAISSYFNSLPQSGSGLYPEQLNFSFKKVQDLRYGENPQQEAAFYAASGIPRGLAAADQLQGKELSFNNLNDLNAAWDLVLEFDAPTAVAVKHANPCGVGTASDLEQAYKMAFEADPVSIFGGVLALNRTVDEKTAREMEKIFLEVIAAPKFSSEAMSVLKHKKEIRLLEIDPSSEKRDRLDLKKIAGGILVQSNDHQPVNVTDGRIVTNREPDEKEWTALNFAQKVVKHVRSNAIVIAGSAMTFGVGAGQMSRIGAARIALGQAGEKAKGAVLGSDAFFPFPDTVEEAARAGITAIVQPGGSQKDQESIDLCNRYGLAMVFTGRRYFKH